MCWRFSSHQNSMLLLQIMQETTIYCTFSITSNRLITKTSYISQLFKIVYPQITKNTQTFSLHLIKFNQYQIRIQLSNQNLNFISNSDMTQYTQDQFSTILNCKEGLLVCSLRGFEGVVSLILTAIFIKGYIAISNSEREVVHKDDKMIYLLSLAQVALQALYYLLFQEFFLLGTIRNLMIWTDILILSNMCKIFLNSTIDLVRSQWGVQAMRFFNFLLWFYVVVVDGTTIENTTFNVGYNCLIPDWIILSGYMLFVTMFIVYIGANLYDKLKWEADHIQNKQAQTKSLQQTILIFTVTTITSSVMMFAWDYVAFLYSHKQQDCVDMFVGNNFPRKILFFVLKIITMQIQPIGIYYCTYYKNRDFIEESKQQFIHNAAEVEDLAILHDDIYSVLNQSLISRGSLAIRSRSSSQFSSHASSRAIL